VEFLHSETIELQNKNTLYKKIKPLIITFYIPTQFGLPTQKSLNLVLRNEQNIGNCLVISTSSVMGGSTMVEVKLSPPKAKPRK
jgi:hypothetical protein